MVIVACMSLSFFSNNMFSALTLEVSPRDMWELHHGGFAKNYEVYGRNTFTINWTQGERLGEGAVLSNET